MKCNECVYATIVEDSTPVKTRCAITNTVNTATNMCTCDFLRLLRDKRRRLTAEYVAIKDHIDPNSVPTACIICGNFFEDGPSTKHVCTECRETMDSMKHVVNDDNVAVVLARTEQ